MTHRSNRFYHFCTAGIILAAAFVYVIGDDRVSLWDRDEAWYAQSSRQMLQTGDWVIPHFLEKPRTAKPILIYWCQAASMKVWGDNALGARFPSALAMTSTLGLLAIALSKALGGRRAMYTILIFATSGLVLVTAKMCIIDSVQLVFVTGAQICLYALYRAGVKARRSPVAETIAALTGAACEIPSPGTPGEGRVRVQGQRASSCTRSSGSEPSPGLRPTSPGVPGEVKGGSAWIAAVFWLCIGMTGLAKGPFVLIITASSLVALAALDVGRQWKSWDAWKQATSWWRLLRPWWGLPLALAVVAPWLITAYVRNRAFVNTLMGEAKRHATSNQSGQWPMPGYFLAAIWVTYFPWCLLLPGALVLAWKHRQTPQVRFALGLVIGNWLIVDLFMTTKLPHYLLPAYASLAFLTATALIRCLRSDYFERHKTGFFVLMSVWAAGGLFMSNIPWLIFARYQDSQCRPGAIAFTVVGLVYVIVVVGLFVRRRLEAAAIAMGLGMFAIVCVLYGLYFPQAQFLRLPYRIAAELKQRGLTQRGQVLMTGYSEPSLAFYQGGTIRDADDMFEKRRYLFDISPEQWPQWIVTTAGLYEDLPPDRQQLLQVVSKHHGINYNTGCRAVDVLILRKRNSP